MRAMDELDRWVDGHATLDIAELSSGYASAGFWADWTQPLALVTKRRVVAALVGVHDAWAEQLRSFPEPHYLGLWLFEPMLVESQVVAAVGPRAAEYAARHTAPLSAPPSAYDGQPLPLARFEWTHHAGDDRDDWLARLAAG